MVSDLRNTRYVRRNGLLGHFSSTVPFSLMHVRSIDRLRALPLKRSSSSSSPGGISSFSRSSSYLIPNRALSAIAHSKEIGGTVVDEFWMLFSGRAEAIEALSLARLDTPC